MAFFLWRSKRFNMTRLRGKQTDPGPRPVPNRVRVGEVVFVIHNDNVEVVYEKLKEIPGIEMVAEPHVKEFPKDDGSVIRVMGISFFDPNGYFIELNQPSWVKCWVSSTAPLQHT